MLDIKYIRENLNEVKKSTLSKNCDVNFDDIINLDVKRREVIKTVEKLKSERNILNQNISSLIKNKEDASSIILDMKNISQKIKELDQNLTKTNAELNEKLLYVPNNIHPTVPIGKDESSNVVIREWGQKPEFNYEIKDHKSLSEINKLIDFKRGAKISGSGFPLYTNNGAKLERALINYMLDVHSNNGYVELFPPFVVTDNSPLTTGNLPKFKDDMYFLESENMYLIPTAEVPITNVYASENFTENDLPKKHVAYSACFRREAGSYGKDTKGLLRLHQFNKVELVKFVHPRTSYDELESLVMDAEKVLQTLGLHYRVVELCTGDLSFSAAKCYDIEVWSPYENKYLEVSSCSNFEAFQSHRGSMRFRSSDTGKMEYVHTLNGSGVATPRLMVALIENYQQKDGTISIPSALQDYMKISLLSK